MTADEPKKIDTTPERWCLPGSGWAPGSYDLVREHLLAVENAICKLAESYTENRTPDGPLIVTREDVRKAIANYDV